MHPNHSKNSSSPEPPNDKAEEPGPSPDGDAEDQHAPRAVAEHLVEQPSTSSVATPAADDHDPSAHPNIKSFQPKEHEESLLQYYFNLDANPTHQTLKNIAKHLGIPGQMISIYRWFQCQRMKATDAQPRESRSTSSASEEELRRGGGNVSTSQQDSGQAMAAPSPAAHQTTYPATNPLPSIPHQTPPLNTSSSQNVAFGVCFLHGPSTSEQTTSITEAPSDINSALVATSSQTLGSSLPSMEYHGIPSTISGDVTPAPDVTFTDEPLDLSQESTQFPSPAKQRKIDNADGSGKGASPLAAGSDTMDSLFSELTDEMISGISQSPSHSSSMAPGVSWHTHMYKERFEDNVGYSFPEPNAPPRMPEFQEGSSYQWPGILQFSSKMDNASELAREGGVQLEIDESDDQKKVDDDDDSSPGEDA